MLEVLERVIENTQIDTARDIILGDKCSWEVLVPVESYLKGWGVSRDWKFQGVFDRKSDLSATGFKSTDDLVFCLLKKEVPCNLYYECDHRVMEVTEQAKEDPADEAASSSSSNAPVGDLLPIYTQDLSSPKSMNEKERPWSLS